MRVRACVCFTGQICEVVGSGEGTIQILPYALLGRTTHPHEVLRKRCISLHLKHMFT